MTPTGQVSALVLISTVMTSTTFFTEAQVRLILTAAASIGDIHRATREALVSGMRYLADSVVVSGCAIRSRLRVTKSIFTVTHAPGIAYQGWRSTSPLSGHGHPVFPSYRVYLTYMTPTTHLNMMMDDVVVLFFHRLSQKFFLSTKRALA